MQIKVVDILPVIILSNSTLNGWLKITYKL